MHCLCCERKRNYQPCTPPTVADCVSKCVPKSEHVLNNQHLQHSVKQQKWWWIVITVIIYIVIYLKCTTSHKVAIIKIYLSYVYMRHGMCPMCAYFRHVIAFTQAVLFLWNSFKTLVTPIINIVRSFSVHGIGLWFLFLSRARGKMSAQVWSDEEVATLLSTWEECL